MFSFRFKYFLCYFHFTGYYWHTMLIGVNNSHLHGINSIQLKWKKRTFKFQRRIHSSQGMINCKKKKKKKIVMANYYMKAASHWCWSQVNFHALSRDLWLDYWLCDESEIHFRNIWNLERTVRCNDVVLIYLKVHVPYIPSNGTEQKHWFRGYTLKRNKSGILRA